MAMPSLVTSGQDRLAVGTPAAAVQPSARHGQQLPTDLAIALVPSTESTRQQRRIAHRSKALPHRRSRYTRRHT